MGPGGRDWANVGSVVRWMLLTGALDCANMGPGGRDFADVAPCMIIANLGPDRRDLSELWLYGRLYFVNLCLGCCQLVAVQYSTESAAVRTGF